MTSIVEERLAEMANICCRFDVARLEIFGSAVTGEFDEKHSDLDFLVEFSSALTGPRFDAFFGLRRALAELFGRSIDLVEAGAPRNPYFIRRVNETRKVVYAA